MSTNSLEHTEMLLEQEREEPLKILTQNTSSTLKKQLVENHEIALSAEVDPETARAGAKAQVSFDSINYKMVAGSIKTAQAAGVELLFFTNAQKDQLGLCARKFMKGNFHFFTPHQIALLLSEIVIENYRQQDAEESGKGPIILRSIALSDAMEVQASYKEIKSSKTYSGLGALSQAIEDDQQDYRILLAVDEANHVLFPGYSAQESVEEGMKLIAEKALALKREGKTLFDFLVELYRQYGFYHEKSFTISKADQEGEKYLKNLMDEVRKQTSDSFFGPQVRIVNDFYKRTFHNLLTAKKGKIILPKADVLQFLFVDNTKLTLVPMENYHKLTYHFSVSSRISGKEAMEEAKGQANERIIRMMERIGKI